VRPRPASTMLRPYGSRRAVRELILNDVDESPPGGVITKR
jgi:putative drug exporter of the RND superfamily